MKKTIRLSVIAVITLMLTMTGIAEARRGDTASDSSSSKTSSSSKITKSPRVSKSPDSSRTSTSQLDSSFANAAKNRQAKVAWQERAKNKDISKPDNSNRVTTTTTSPVFPRQNDNSRDLERQLADLQSQLKTEKKRKKADKITRQLAAIERQIAEAKRQQQMIAIAQTATQVAVNNRSNTGINNRPVNSAVEKDKKSSSGTSWFTILLVIGGIVLVIMWLRKGSSTTTIYRL